MVHLSYWIEMIMSGVVTGACYAMIGAGLSLIWGTLKMVNLAHGEYYMLGAYFLWMLLTVGNLPLALAVIISIIGVIFFASIIHMAAIRPLLRKPGWNMSPWILTLGIQILLQNLALQIWGELYRNVPYFWSRVFKPLGMFTMSGQRIIILAGTVIVILALMYMIKRTRLGRAIIAGIFMGIIESAAVSVIGSEWRDAVAYIFLLIVLYIKPTGLFGKKKGV